MLIRMPETYTDKLTWSRWPRRSRRDNLWPSVKLSTWSTRYRQQSSGSMWTRSRGQTCIRFRPPHTGGRLEFLNLKFKFKNIFEILNFTAKPKFHPRASVDRCTRWPCGRGPARAGVENSSLSRYDSVFRPWVVISLVDRSCTLETCAQAVSNPPTPSSRIGGDLLGPRLRSASPSTFVGRSQWKFKLTRPTARSIIYTIMRAFAAWSGEVHPKNQISKHLQARKVNHLFWPVRG